MATTTKRAARTRRLSRAFMNYLKFHRMSLGLTQAEVAKRARVSQGAYCDYENGHRKPRPKEHRNLALALQRPVEEFTAKLYGVDAASMGGAPGQLVQ